MAGEVHVAYASLTPPQLPTTIILSSLTSHVRVPLQHSIPYCLLERSEKLTAFAKKMPFPFGVSVGDFIACIELINTVINCLDQSNGSDSRFRDVITSLKSLEIALMQVNNIATSSNDEAALRQVAIQCRSTLSGFLDKIKKYQPSFQLGGSGNHLKDSLRKVQWALYTKDDIAHFQLEIRGHVDSILILLGMIQT